MFGIFRKKLLERDPLRRTDHFEHLTRKYLDKLTAPRNGGYPMSVYHGRERLGSISEEYNLVHFDKWLQKKGYENGAEADLFIAQYGDFQRCTLFSRGPPRTWHILGFLLYKKSRFSINELGKCCLSLKNPELLRTLFEAGYWYSFKEDRAELLEYCVRNWHSVAQDDLRDVIRELKPDAFPSAHVPAAGSPILLPGAPLSEGFMAGHVSHAQYNRAVLSRLLTGNALEAPSALLERLTEIHKICLSLLEAAVECPRDLVREKARNKEIRENFERACKRSKSLAEFLPQCEVTARNWIQTLEEAHNGFKNFSEYFASCAEILGQSVARDHALADVLKTSAGLLTGSAVTSLSTEQMLERLLICNQIALASIEQIRVLVIPSVWKVTPPAPVFHYADTDMSTIAQGKSELLRVALNVVDTTMQAIASAFVDPASLRKDLGVEAIWDPHALPA